MMFIVIAVSIIGWNDFEAQFNHTKKDSKTKMHFALLSGILGFCSSFLIILYFSRQQLDGWTILFYYIWTFLALHVCVGIFFRLIGKTKGRYISDIIFAALSFVLVYWFTIANILL